VEQLGRKSLGALTGARFLAALWVLVYHYTVEFRFANVGESGAYQYGHRSPLELVIGQGHLAVDFFFILSGFILAYTYLTDENTVRGGKRVFWVARIARIYPVYLLGLLLGLGPYLATEHNLQNIVLSVGSHVVMLHAWLPGALDLNQPSWSLSVEAFFYALFPLLLPLFARLRRRGLIVILVGSWLFFGLLLASLALLGQATGWGDLWWWRDFVRYNPFINLPDFTAGMTLGILFVRSDLGTRLPFNRFRAPTFDVAIIALVACLAAVIIGFHHFGVQSDVIDTFAPLVLPVLAALIFLLAFQRGLIARALSLPIAVWLGEISYGVYILHEPMWGPLSGFAKQALQMQPGNVVLIPVYFVLVIAVAGLSFKYLEGPTRRAIRRRWGRPKVAVAVKLPQEVHS
jgi:peptidoglycan/LPS O-acetylase OafA/YrhL